MISMITPLNFEPVDARPSLPDGPEQEMPDFASLLFFVPAPASPPVGAPLPDPAMAEEPAEPLAADPALPATPGDPGIDITARLNQTEWVRMPAVGRTSDNPEHPVKVAEPVPSDRATTPQPPLTPTVPMFAPASRTRTHQMPAFAGQDDQPIFPSQQFDQGVASPLDRAMPADTIEPHAGSYLDAVREASQKIEIAPGSGQAAEHSPARDAFHTDLERPAESGSAERVRVTGLGGLLNLEKLFAVRTSQAEVPAAAPKMAEPSRTVDQAIPEIVALAAHAGQLEKKTMRMRLHPAELGTVEIRLEKSADNRLTAHLHAETEAARNAIGARLDELRTSLSDAGWVVEQLEVTYQQSSPFGSNAGDGRNMPQNETGRTTPHNSDAAGHQPETADTPGQPSDARLLSVRA